MKQALRGQVMRLRADERIARVSALSFVVGCAVDAFSEPCAGL